MGLNRAFSQIVIQQMHRFTPFLRENGFRVGTAETLLAMQTLQALNLESMEQVLHALRSVYAKTDAEWSLFPSLFKRHFSLQQHQLTTPQAMEHVDGGEGRPFSTDKPIPLSIQGAMLPGYSPHTGQQYPLQFFSDQDVEQLMKWTKQAALKLERPPSRRLEKGKGSRIDFRRTLRLAMRHGGEPIKLAYLRPRLARPKIVLVIDVSGSMKDYADLFLTIAWAFMQSIARVEVFIFSTTIKRITPFLVTTFFRGIPLEELVELKGGTKIGYSLSRLNEQYASLLSRRTSVFIISDGYDTGDAKILRRGMEQLASRVSRIIWCNPLLGEEEYEPISMGMQTALPYLDQFIDVHDPESWIKAVRFNLLAKN